MELENVSIKKITNLIERYRTQVFTAIIFGGIIISGAIYWQYSKMQQEQNALQALTEILMEYNRAHENYELWQDVEVGARTGYRQYAKSSLAPFFLGLQAEALIQQDKFDDGIALMNILMKQLSETSPFYYLFSIKLARMKLASENPTIQQEGLQELTKLSENQKNPHNEQAHYYLGLYYQNHDQQEKASQVWKTLASTQQEKAPDQRSVWSMLAEQQLK